MRSGLAIVSLLVREAFTQRAHGRHPGAADSSDSFLFQRSSRRLTLDLDGQTGLGDLSTGPTANASGASGEPSEERRASSASTATFDACNMVWELNERVTWTRTGDVQHWAVCKSTANDNTIGICRSDGRGRANSWKFCTEVPDGGCPSEDGGTAAPGPFFAWCDDLTRSTTTTSLPTLPTVPPPVWIATDPPTSAPTQPPATPVPTLAPTEVPTPAPTEVPTPVPTSAPTQPPATPVPTLAPTEVPTPAPTEVPTPVPTSAPTQPPATPVPTLAPTEVPTPVPTRAPTQPPATPVPTRAPPPEAEPDPILGILGPGAGDDDDTTAPATTTTEIVRGPSSVSPTPGPSSPSPTPDLPETTLTVAIAAGATTLPVASEEGFNVGDRIAVSDSVERSVSEEVSISSFGSIVLAEPLVNSYSAGSIVRCVGHSGATTTDAGSGATTTTTTTDAGSGATTTTTTTTPVPTRAPPPEAELDPIDGILGPGARDDDDDDDTTATDAGSGASGGGSASIEDDPHVCNLNDECFDIRAGGKYTLLRVPYEMEKPDDLKVDALLGTDGVQVCGMYIKQVVVSGALLDHSVRILPRTRNMGGSNSAGNATKFDFSVQVDNSPWTPFSDKPADRELAGNSSSIVRVRFVRREEFGVLLESQSVQIEVGPPGRSAVISVSQASHQALNLQLTNAASMGYAKLQGVLGTDTYDQAKMGQASIECLEASRPRRIARQQQEEPERPHGHQEASSIRARWH